MTLLSKEEYLKLLQSLEDESEDPNIYKGDHIPDYGDWMPAEPPAKEAMKRSLSHGRIDVTKYRKKDIQAALYKCVNVVVGDYILHIDEYHGHPETLKKGGDLTLDISLLKVQYKTPSGAPCRMELRFDPNTDKQFRKQAWISRFDSDGHADYVPVSVAVEIVRWLQGLSRMTAFL